jgi:hypothetical protein
MFRTSAPERARTRRERSIRWLSTRLLVPTVCSLGIIDVAFAQETGNDGDGYETPIQADEEVVVVGRSLGDLRRQIQLAQEAVFAKFNEINSDDAFDVRCRRVTPTGTHISQRVCEPNFWRDAQAEAAEEMLRSGAPAEMFLAPARVQGQKMAEELRRLAYEDKEFNETLAHLGQLVLESEGDRNTARSTAMILTDDMLSDSVLPYGAALAAQVRIGRRQWRHDLMHPTFAIGRLVGKIEQLELRCRDNEEVLQYESGSEWTLPDDWQSCSLRVGATEGTRFVLYEFEPAETND